MCGIMSGNDGGWWGGWGGLCMRLGVGWLEWIRGWEFVIIGWMENEDGNGVVDVDSGMCSSG